MSRYVIVSFLKKTTAGRTFSKLEWPLHLTVLRPFFSDTEDSKLIETLQISLAEKQKIALIGKSKELFGQNTDIVVTELEYNVQIQDLHNSVEGAFGSFVSFESKQYLDYRPHVTTQGNESVEVGEKVVIDSVSLVKFNNDSRQVLVTIILKDPAVFAGRVSPERSLA